LNSFETRTKSDCNEAWRDVFIVLKPDPIWWADPGLKPGRVEEKIGKEKTRLTRRVDPDKNPVAIH
jgi:hypothetical protein